MARAMDKKDEIIHRLEHRIDERERSPVRPPIEIEENNHLKHEISTLKNENRLLRDKISGLTNDFDRISRERGTSIGNENELRRLRTELAEKVRENERQMAQIRELMHGSDKNSSKQKSEWNELYGNMKRESDDLKRDIRLLNQENERLLKQLEQSRTSSMMGGSTPSATEKEIAKRLKKRELECQALWESLKDMNSGRGVFDARQMLEILSVRALDTKAKRKLGI